LAVQAFVWLLGALLCVAPALPALHFALVLHRICPEHGELLHVGQADIEPGSGASASAEHGAEKGPALHAASSGPSEHAHGHDLCGVASGGAGACALPTSLVSQALASQDVTARSVQGANAHVGIALLSYAPKLAPPASQSRLIAGVAPSV
jgi:hypothetical protein